MTSPTDPQVPSDFRDIVLAEFKPCKVVLADAGITQYVYEDCAYYTKPVTEGEYHTADWMISFDERLIGVQIYHYTLDAQSAERTHAEHAKAAERIPDLALAIEGCEKFSSDADFEMLGALIYRNRAVILAALAGAERTRAEVEGLTATLEDEQAAHIDTLRLLTNARAEVAEMEDAGILAVKKARAEVEKMREAAAKVADEHSFSPLAFNDSIAKAIAAAIRALPIEGIS